MPATLRVVGGPGGPIYANAAGDSGASRRGDSLWMPRVAASYRLGERTIAKGGYGLYYDVLTAADYDASQTGYNVTKVSTISDDLGRRSSGRCPRRERAASIRSPSAPTAHASTRRWAIRSV
jgi:hypothetical protein